MIRYCIYQFASEHRSIIIMEWVWQNRGRGEVGDWEITNLPGNITILIPDSIREHKTKRERERERDGDSVQKQPEGESILVRVFPIDSLLVPSEL